MGKRLVDLHLFDSKELNHPSAKYRGKGNNKIENVKFDSRQGKVFINPNQYFEGIVPNIWNYQIGGYQICHKWLKDRKGRNLSLDDLKHYCKIISAIEKTIDLQNKIDAIYPEIEQEIIQF